MSAPSTPVPIRRLAGFPGGVQAAITWRGADSSPYGYNLGLKSGDDRQAVVRRRKEVSEWMGATPHWLNQVHGCAVHRPSRVDGQRTQTEEAQTEEAQADACVTRDKYEACVVLVADCLPVLMSLSSGEAVAAAHAGWRGLAAGVLEATLSALIAQAHEPSVVAWLGPCIGPDNFEVGREVVETFGGFEGPAMAHFQPSASRSDRWYADLQGLAMAAMLRWAAQAGCTIRWAAPPGGCTYQDSQQWFSYRREGVTGRMSALIWRESE